METEEQAEKAPRRMELRAAEERFSRTGTWRAHPYLQ